MGLQCQYQLFEHPSPVLVVLELVETCASQSQQDDIPRLGGSCRLLYGGPTFGHWHHSGPPKENGTFRPARGCALSSPPLGQIRSTPELRAPAYGGLRSWTWTTR